MAGGRGRVTTPGSVVACQMAPGAVCADAQELMMALLADSIVLAPSAAGGGDSQLQHINDASITDASVDPNQPPIQSVPRFFPRGKEELTKVAPQIKLNQIEWFISWILSIVVCERF